jgi:hypothetical protein
MAMNEEFRRAMAQGWEEAKKAKAKRRKANQEKWAQRRDWSDDNQHKVDVAIEANGAGGSRSLAALRTIMADPDTPLHRRLDAAEVVLAYELGPGAAVGADVEQIAAGSYVFLNTVIDTPGTPEALRFRCLKMVASVENARAASKNTIAQDAAKRILVRNLVNAERTRAIRASGNWPEAVKTTAWALTSVDTFEWPTGWPGDWSWPLASFSVLLEQAFDVTTFRELLLSIRASNRPDDWEKFLAPTYQILRF